MAGRIGFHLTIFILFQVLTINGNETTGEFDFVKCIWNGTHCVKIEKIQLQPDLEDMISEWPSGPYALPMPVDGCPESRLKGWEKGYIDLTLQDSHVVLSTTESARETADHTDTLEQTIDVTSVQLPDIQSSLIGPYSRYKIKLNFCFKMKRNETFDVGVWPDGNYSIYGDKTGCPNGLSNGTIKIMIGKISHSTYDGYLPQFNLHRSDDNADYIEVLICTHTMNNNQDLERNLMVYSDPFILLPFDTLQYENRSIRCPLIFDTSVTKETLYVHLSGDSSNITELFRLCYFRPNNWKPDTTLMPLDNRLIPQDTFTVRVWAATGEVTLLSERFANQQRNIQVDTMQGITELLTSDSSQSTKVRWKLLDLGRTLSVYGIFAPVWQTKEELRCYYSNAKWDFLHFGAPVCSFIVKYTKQFASVSDKAGFTLLFKRVFESRYLAFMDGPEHNFSSLFSTDVEITVLTTNYTYLTDANAHCNIDMGMTDHGIDNFQISASSWLQNFPASSARPFLSSWCANADDTSPWLLIDLYRAMRVEGITIWNREYVYETINNGSVDKHFLKMGVRSFSVSFGDTENNLTLYNNQVFLLDALYPVEATQSFEFHRPFYARFIKIHVLEALANHLSCLRFELHGCRKTGTKILECQNSTVMKRVPAIHNPFQNPQHTFSNLTSNECYNLCVNNTECSIVNHFRDGSCLHYGTDNNRNWMLVSSGTSDMISSVKFCTSDYIETPYVAYTFKTTDIKHMNKTILTYLSLIRDAFVLTSVGFPFNYGTKENYKWLISFDETEFIKLVFTNVNMNVYTHSGDTVVCQDKLLFNEEAHRYHEDIKAYNVDSNTFENTDGVFQIDSSYNDRIFTVESELSYMTLTFTTCDQTNVVIHKGDGFRAIISKSYIPACLSLEGLAYLNEERVEFCDKPRMFLSSMAYLNIPFARRNETWIIYRKKGVLRIDIKEFNIKCSTDIRFSIEERFAGEKKFCNLERPPNIIYTASSSATVRFTSQFEKSDDVFRLVFKNVFETLGNMSEAITSKGADIPAIYQSIFVEAKLTKDVETKTLFLSGYLSFDTSPNTPRLLYKVCSRKFGKCFSIFSFYGTWNRAGSECWIRQKRLLSIRNKAEFKFIKYLLRNFKLLLDIDSEILGSAFRHNYTEIYYTYIGLRRDGRGNDRNAFFWENRTPVTFSSWKTGQPSTGDCTRMGFYMANDDQTWETHNCLERSAFYFVCESIIGNSTQSMKDRQFSKQYRGNASVTFNGYTCQRWDSQYPHKHFYTVDDLFPDKTITEAANFCRDPTESNNLWCLTTDPDVLWDGCYLNELNEDMTPISYRGKLDMSSDGRKCVASDGLTKAYCRHPFSIVADIKTAHDYLWCYGTDNDAPMAMDVMACDLTDTARDRCDYTHFSYSGTLNVTTSGKPCERWDLFLSQDKFEDLQLPYTDLNGSSNYCRDPTSNGFPWCYISYPQHFWEVCTVRWNIDETFDQPDKYFECTDGKLVYSFEHCNGVIDCQDASDENNCLVKFHPLLERTSNIEGDVKPDSENFDSTLFFKCNSQDLISFLSLCDGVLDCQDASDEINCTHDSANCSKDQFTCGDGSCIHVSRFCNFISDCTDSSDEDCDYQLCSENEYVCANGQCILAVERCNAITDCMDGTDEGNCDSCKPGTFHCDYVRCLPSRFQCDTYLDCDDGSDEASCEMSDMMSCREWWDAGYRKSGIYKVIIAGFVVTAVSEVYCDFSFIHQRSELYTVFQNVDIMEWEGNTVIYTGIFGEIPFETVIDYMFTSDASCTQEVVQTCTPSVKAASERDDPDNVHPYTFCYCIVVTLVIGLEPQISNVRFCNDSEPLSTVDIDNMLLFTYTYTANHRAINWKNVSINLENIQLRIGNVTCKEMYAAKIPGDRLRDITKEPLEKSDTVTCGDGHNVYNTLQACIYDVDRTGTMTGCRSGSHLQTCDADKNICPYGTVQCPGSYCIPLRFVCDGKEQCPNSEDENGCGCEDIEKEVIIIHEESMNNGPDILKLAKQLYTPKSIIRRLKYKSTKLSNGIPFLHRILQIKDTEMTPSDLLDRNYQCEYKLLANQFLDSVRFTKQNERSVLFIQSSHESELIAELMFTNLSRKSNITIYRLLESLSSTLKVVKFPYVIDVAVKNWSILSSLAPRYLPHLCREAFATSYPGSYKCSSSKICITRDQVCDKHADCIHGDDELLCDFVCPHFCVCNGFVVTCIRQFLNNSDINLFPEQTRSLTIHKLGMVDEKVDESMLHFPLLYMLNLSNCKINEIKANAFIKLRNLRILDISNNEFTHLFSLVFNGLQRLKTLLIDGNKKLTTLEPFTFQFLNSIKSLRIDGTSIRTLVSNTFAGLSLTHLSLQNNEFQAVEEFGIGNFVVEHVDFKSNIISTFDKGMFTGVSTLKSLRTPAYKYCCVRPSYVLENDCFPHKDEFSSCEDLMRISILQTMLWLIGLCALLGNIFSVIYRLQFDRERLKLGYGIFVTNLAVADFFMGIYLIIIAVADAVFRNRYIFMDDYWRNSFWCTFAGVLSTLSSEASVMFLCLITLDRLLVIKYPFGQVRFDSKKALIISLAVWIICLVISVFPLMYSSYFQSSFYNKSGVCIALPLTRDRPPGWIYSVLIFVGFNFVTFLLIAIGQWTIYMDIRKSGRALGKGQAARRKDLLVARNLLLVVGTDFLCWFPIGCTGLMALSGRVISGDVYAWAAVFILPVNSALNPVLYTLTAILGKKSFTPRTQEQSKQTVHTSLGKRFLVNKTIIARRFYTPDASSPDSYYTLTDALQASEVIPVSTMLKMSHQLVQTLLVLHKSSLMLGKIDEQSLYVKVCENKITGDIQLRHDPNICGKPMDTYNDMYKFGLFLSVLLNKMTKVP